MKKTILVLAALLGFTVQANAAWNIIQKEDGGAVWEEGKTSDQVPVGDSGLVAYLTSVADPMTTFVVSHKSGNLKMIYAVNHATFQAASNAAALSFSVGPGTGNGVWTPVSNPGIGAVITFITGEVGRKVTFAPQTIAGRPNVRVNQGDVIAIISNGIGTGAVNAHVTIVIE